VLILINQRKRGGEEEEEEEEERRGDWNAMFVGGCSLFTIACSVQEFSYVCLIVCL
jgi:hypothetical protein